MTELKPNDDREFERLRRWANILDSAFQIPGTNIRVGLDGIVGLLPGVGDVLGAIASTLFVLAAARLGVPKHALLRMVGNVAIESVVGAVPILGDIFDLGWKANQRNLQILEGYRGRPMRSAEQITRLILAAVVSFLVVLSVCLMLLLAALIRLLGELF